MSYAVSWDDATNLPIVDGKIERLGTGVVEQAGAKKKFGPPAIDLIWRNKTPTPNFKGSRGPCFLKLDELLANIAALFVSQGSELRLVTITASAYHAFVLCETSKLTLTMDDVWEFSCGRIGLDDGRFTKPHEHTSHTVVEHDTIDQAGGRAMRPSFSVIWHNMTITSDFRTVEKTIGYSPESLYIKVGEHVRTGLYHVVSLNVSSSSLIVVCETECSLEEFLKALSDGDV